MSWLTYLGRIDLYSRGTFSTQRSSGSGNRPLCNLTCTCMCRVCDERRVYIDIDFVYNGAMLGTIERDNHTMRIGKRKIFLIRTNVYSSYVISSSSLLFLLPWIADFFSLVVSSHNFTTNADNPYYSHSNISFSDNGDFSSRADSYATDSGCAHVLDSTCMCALRANARLHIVAFHSVSSSSRLYYI